MAPRSSDVIVIGAGGAMGSSACLHLARRGAAVLGLEQFGPALPHSRGSSHGHTRIIRSCYYEHPDYVPLLTRSYELWRSLESESSRPLLFQTGGVYIGGPGSPTVDGSARAAAAHGLPHEVLDRDETRRRWPQFSLPAGWEAFHDPAAGYLLCEDAVSVQVDYARSAGCELLTGQRVLDWSARPGSVTVRTDAATFEAGAVIIAAGAWAGRVVNELGAPITPTRQVLAWFAPRNGQEPSFAADRFPIWAFDNQEDGGASIYYGFPHHPGTPGVKAALHKPGLLIDPDDADSKQPRSGDTRELGRAVQAILPGLAADDAPPLGAAVCMYENSPDGHFIIDRHPLHANVFVCAGFSGHGFKFAPVVGEIMADLALAGSTRHPIEFLGLGRFAQSAG